MAAILVLITLCAVPHAVANAKPPPLVPGSKLFGDRDYIAEVPAALKGIHFLPVAMNGQKTLKCERPGTVKTLRQASSHYADHPYRKLIETFAEPKTRASQEWLLGN